MLDFADYVLYGLAVFFAFIIILVVYLLHQSQKAVDRLHRYPLEPVVHDAECAQLCAC
jgi:hypothetical protein